MTLLQLIEQAAAFHRSGQLAQAERIYQQVLEQDRKNYAPLYLMGVLRMQQNRNEEALALLQEALRIHPKALDGLLRQASVLLALGRPEEALASIDKALKIDAANADLHYLRAASFLALNRAKETLDSLGQAIKLRPDFADALLKRASLLLDMGQTEQALAGYDRVIAVRGDIMVAHLGRAQCLQDLGRPAEALVSCDRALTLAPGYAGTLFTRGNILRELGRPEEARTSFERALTLNPGHPHALNGAAESIFAMCDWPAEVAITGKIIAAIHAETAIIEPFLLRGTDADAATHLRCAQLYSRSRTPPGDPLWKGERYGHGKIRLAYLSSDFREHAVASLSAGLFERHDRDRFEIHGVSFGPDKDSPMRARMKKAFDRFHDVISKSAGDVAALLRELEVDIAVDLVGYTGITRPQILFQRPCPVQVNYLGYPGTMGTELIDYIIADPVVAPFAHQPHYAEKIVHLPGSYQANDDRRPVPQVSASRAEMGLPEKGLVFCCFNNNWKITEPVFSIWMRLLKAAPDSVLWLLEDNAYARAWLEKAAASRGIDPKRLVFAERVMPQEHLARHAHADLFLDTLPYCAHTTCSDALWMGLPLVTCLGAGFQGRVAASLLGTVGLPELVTHNLEDYEKLAGKLAGDPALLKSLRERLVRERAQSPLFDTDLFRRHIEAAYVTMWEAAERGEAPRSFSVAN